MVKPALFVSACALLVSVAVGAPSSAQTSCMAGADFVQHLRKLPEKPDDSGYEYLVFGNTAAEMFSEYPGKVHNDHLYIFSATFDKCEPSRAFAQGEPKRGPHTEIASRKSAYDLSLQVKFDHSLAKMYKPLPYDSHDYSVYRGDGWAESSGVDIKGGEVRQECVILLGWNCTASLKLIDFSESNATVISKVHGPTFFPAALKSEPHFWNAWIPSS